jgi:hypothetical protein
MPLAEIGPLTGAFEIAATTTGAGILLGSFVLGTISFLRGASRRTLEKRVLTDGYIGGLVGVLVIFTDLVMR